MQVTSSTARSRNPFAPAPPAEKIASDPAEIRAGFNYWQPRILLASTIGYTIFYFVRVNLPVAMPAIERDLHITKTDLGLFITLHGVIYGLSKFFNGFLGDRCNARFFMATGLLLSAICNFVFGSSSLAIAMGVSWVFNGYFQGMGFPPCARLLTHWFTPKQLPTRMSIWNTSHSLGACLVFILCGWLVEYNWRLCFYVPAVLALVAVVYLLIFLRDTPESLGLPSVDALDPSTKPVTLVEEESESYSHILLTYVFNNPWIWLVSIANFFVYSIRYFFVTWGPTFLSQEKHIQLSHASWMISLFEASGMPGALLGGWLAHRIFGGRAHRAALPLMIACGVCVFLFWKIPTLSATSSTVLFCLIGFFIYGPQCLIGIAAANLATRRAAAAAVGLTGLFGYASSVAYGWGAGYLIQHYGWTIAFEVLIAIALAGTIVFIAAWPAKAHGYKS